MKEIIKHDNSAHEFWNKGGFVLCTAGSAEVRINGQLYSLSRGSIFMVIPLVQINDLVPSPDFEKISFVNELKIFYPVFKLIADTGIPLRVSENPCWQLSEEEVLFVKTQYKRVEEKTALIGSSRSTDEQQMLSNLINLISVETMLEVVSNRVRTSEVPINAVRNSNVAYRFILSLHENYRTERTVNWYADQANLSTGHFSAIIREATGQSPSDWISSVTISYAKLMLEQTDKNIKEIAHDLNFPEQFTFRKYFKRYTGMSPTDYRKAWR